MTKIGRPLPWSDALPLVRALRDIAQASTDDEAVAVATDALREIYSDDGLRLLFGDDLPETVGQMLGLDQHDPWDQRTDAEKARDAERQVRREASIAAHEALPTDLPTFCDRPDDERLTIQGNGNIYHRLMIAGRKLSVVFQADPSLPDILVAARNNAQGCWVALNSQRVAQRAVAALQSQQMDVVLETVDQTGTPVSATLDEAGRQRILAGLGGLTD